MERPRKRSTLIGKINRDYVYISNNMTTAYERKYGLYCDLYFPLHNKSPQKVNKTDNYKQVPFMNSYNGKGEYENVDIFEPHEQPAYKPYPDVTDAKFYIPYLLKKENMNSTDLEFDSIFLGDYEKRPFIETTKKRELPISTKVVVYIEQSKMNFTVDKKNVVNGANGNMLLRMYLAPLLEENDEGDQLIIGED